MAISTLTPTHRYAAAALFSLALRQAHIHQIHPLPSSLRDSALDDAGDAATAAAAGDGSLPWTHPSLHLLRSVFRAWRGLEETALLSPLNHHVGAFLRLLSEDSSESSSESEVREHALSKAVDVMAMSFEERPSSSRNREKQAEYENYCRVRSSTTKVPSTSEVGDAQSASIHLTESMALANREEALHESVCNVDEKFMLGDMPISYQRRVAVLFDLISACVADIREDDKKQSQVRKGYDAHHRVASNMA